MFYLGALLTEDCAARETALQTALRSSSKERKEEPGYMGDFAGKKNVLKNQKITATQKKPRHLKLVILVLSMYKKMQESGVIEMTPSMCVLTI